MSKPINIVFAGLGGHGVIKASDIFAQVAFQAGKDVKKSEVHGMSQRGGSVSSDVRIGENIQSPMIPDGESDFLIVLSEDQIPNNKHRLKEGGVLITSEVLTGKLKVKKSLNVALLGCLSSYLDIDEEIWLSEIKKSFPENMYDKNVESFTIGKTVAQETQTA
ncbi:MAG: 2-oxoacid:acceptor oxidoreductase family protein [SAR324 cluster bacterium]|nr:2-oxoacid:acceptor oxidoreductase family protein [SAR324 cluster bacterium]